MSWAAETSRLKKHFFAYPISALPLPLPRATPEVIDERLRAMTAAGSHPRSVEQVRRKLRAIFNAAKRSP